MTRKRRHRSEDQDAKCKKLKSKTPWDSLKRGTKLYVVIVHNQVFLVPVQVLQAADFERNAHVNPAAMLRGDTVTTDLLAQWKCSKETDYTFGGKFLIANVCFSNGQ